jgi:hypothetical protein
MLTTEQLKEQYAYMESFNTPKYPCGRYRIACKQGLYWLSKDGSLELIYEYSDMMAKNWFNLA